MPHTYLSPKRLTLARELAGFTEESFARVLGLRASDVRAFENGKKIPDNQTLSRICMHTKMRPGFFDARSDDPPNVATDACFFGQGKRPARLMAVSYLRLIAMLFSFFERQGVAFKDFNFPEISGANPEERALNLRKILCLGAGRIDDMTGLAERMGVRVVILPKHIPMRRMSAWIDGNPYVGVNENLSGAARRVCLAIDFARILFAYGSNPDDPCAMLEANLFALSFLMPETGFRAVCPKKYNEYAFCGLAKYWNVPVESLLMRALFLGILDENEYSKGIERIKESGLSRELEMEEPAESTQMIPTACRLSEAGVDDIAQDLGLDRKFVMEMLALADVSIDVPVKKVAKILDFAERRKCL